MFNVWALWKFHMIHLHNFALSNKILSKKHRFDLGTAVWCLTGFGRGFGVLLQAWLEMSNLYNIYFFLKNFFLSSSRNFHRFMISCLLGRPFVSVWCLPVRVIVRTKLIWIYFVYVRRCWCVSRRVCTSNVCYLKVITNILKWMYVGHWEFGMCRKIWSVNAFLSIHAVLLKLETLLIAGVIQTSYSRITLIKTPTKSLVLIIYFLWESKFIQDVKQLRSSVIPANCAVCMQL